MNLTNSTMTNTDCNHEPEDKIVKGFVLSTLAGLMTMIGAVTVFYPVQKRQMRLASCFCLATASGVMCYVSLVEVFHEAESNFKEAFELKYPDNEKKQETLALLAATGSFFIGWVVALGMDNALHKLMASREQKYTESGPREGPDSTVLYTPAVCEPETKGPCCDEDDQAQLKFDTDTFRIMKVGWFTALALTLHNIPEGLLTYVSCLSDNPSVGLGIACAIGLHNIPEGFAVAFPIKIATNSNRKAMFYAGITGLAEPVGAFIGYLIFGSSSEASEGNLIMFGFLFGITAGIMTEVAIKSLLLESSRYDPLDRIVSKAWIFGAFVIGASLIVIQATTPDSDKLCDTAETTQSSIA